MYLLFRGNCKINKFDYPLYGFRFGLNSFENTYTTTTDGRGSPIPRTGSPDRSRSPYRSMSPNRMMEQTFSAVDVDPEMVRASLRDFVQQLASAERERVRVQVGYRG